MSASRPVNHIWPRITSLLWMLILCFGLEGFTDKTALLPEGFKTEVLFTENQRGHSDVNHVTQAAKNTPHLKKTIFVSRSATLLLLSKLSDQACQLALRQSPQPLSSLKKGATPYTAKSRLDSSDDSIFSLNS